MVGDRIRAHAARITGLLATAGPAVATPIPNSEWTVADAAAHLITGAREYETYFRGVPSPVTDMTDTAASNAALLAAYPEREATVLVGDLSPEVDAMVAAYEDGDPDRRLTWHTGFKVPARALAEVLLGELVMHGWDMAQALRMPWPIDPADAALVLHGGLHIAPTMVDLDAARGMNGVVEVRLRGATRTALTWRDGALTVGPPAAKADCVVSADPLAMLLQTYGRGPKWRPLLTGKVLAYGRRPMLAVRMLGALRNP